MTTPSTAPQSVPGAAALIEMISASWMSQAISAAAELGLADLLAHGARTVEALSVEAGCHPPSLHRLLRSLASLGLLSECDDGAFALTTLGALLRAEAPYAVHAWAQWWGRHRWPLPGELVDAIRSGRGPRRRTAGNGGSATRESDTPAAAVFNRAMVELTRIVAVEMVQVRDFSAVNHVVDVGGGWGEMLAVLLSHHPQMRGTLFDLPGAVTGAAEHLARAGVAGRCQFVAGSFLDAVPAGADLYLLKSVLHSWDDAHCLRILGNCRCAMADGATLLLVERVMPARMTGSAGEWAVARSDLHMLLGSGGLERTQDELQVLLADAGFQPASFMSAGPDHTLIEALAC